MDNLNKVPSSGTTFGKVVDAVNENFGLVLTAITELEQTNKRKYLFTNEAELKATLPTPWSISVPPLAPGPRHPRSGMSAAPST